MENKEITMYTLRTEHSFDAAHFLSGYNGKCANIHGHRWRVIIEICSDSLESEGQTRGMLVDFGELKSEVKAAVDYFDHCMIYEKGTLKAATLQAFNDEGFRLVEVEFRPTAENFAEYFYKVFKDKGYRVKAATVYETPNNCACYSEV
jgi:6-pyruvoyltetrahydropterin/6-carboxytetrahydropterin synthase